ncbi:MULTISPECIES: FtsW/RodA/SpoVE family cell cycle protein [Paenibacillus]|uniref:FtsW/RodA/SpoVE family cell cycle protein n=1 Tax=Paenibacillus TaxID=44249 RepID=UPI0022B92BBE|nr:FtsW/RodA/SpoVE family cell cycle protein [Paenibacillus caseinilyticus]MCZ8521788.1 FtsW/RodA/SpoVE family cell cycle protein [Paenibacillus caseinilyticus]
MIWDQEEVRSYLNQVCSKIRAREVHREIRQELASHIEELAEEKEAEGCAREEAVRWAVRQMGDPAEVGWNLHRIHRPRLHAGLLAGVLLLVLLGVISMYAVDAAVGYGVLLEHRIAGAASGMGALLGLYFFDYRKLEDWPGGLYSLALVAMFACLWGYLDMAGRRVIPMSPFLLDWMIVSCLLILSAAGNLRAWRTRRRGVWLKSTCFYVLVPLLFFVKFHWFLGLLVYLSGYTLVCAMVTGRHTLAALQTCGGLGLSAGLAMWVLDKREQILHRLDVFMNPNAHNKDGSYQIMEMKEAIESAGWWGHGVGNLGQKLPGLSQESVLAYLIHSFGWWSGAFLIAAVILLLSSMGSVPTRVSDPYGRAVSAGLTAMLAVQFGYSILMTFGWLPIIGISPPFFSADTSCMMIEMAVIGLVLGIYRRKDIIGKGGKHVVR